MLIDYILFDFPNKHIPKRNSFYKAFIIRNQKINSFRYDFSSFSSFFHKCIESELFLINNTLISKTRFKVAIKKIIFPHLLQQGATYIPHLESVIKLACYLEYINPACSNSLMRIKSINGRNFSLGFINKATNETFILASNFYQMVNYGARAKMNPNCYLILNHNKRLSSNVGTHATFRIDLKEAFINTIEFLDPTSFESEVDEPFKISERLKIKIGFTRFKTDSLYSEKSVIFDGLYFNMDLVDCNEKDFNEYIINIFNRIEE